MKTGLVNILTEEMDVNTDEIANRVTDAVFKCGDEPNSPTDRIQFRGQDEEDLGGLNRKALKNLIYATLNECVSDEHVQIDGMGRLLNVLLGEYGMALRKEDPEKNKGPE